MGIMGVRDVCVGHGHAVLLQGGDVGERNHCFHPVEAGEPDVTGDILDHVAVQVRQRPAWIEERSDIFVTEQAAKTCITAGLVGKHVWFSAVCRTAHGIVRCTVDTNSDKVRECLPGIGRHLGRLS
jgi:hypothetical protein